MIPLLLLMVGCADGPDPCDTMCHRAAELYGGCLVDWGADWTAAGYADADDFVGACETWAVEMRLLEDELDQRGWTDRTCDDRANRFADGECSDFTDTDWNQMPGATGG